MVAIEHLASTMPVATYRYTQADPEPKSLSPHYHAGRGDNRAPGSCSTRITHNLVRNPYHCYTTSTQVDPADVVVIEGILVLAMEEVREQLNMKIYVDTDDDVRLARRIQRDVAARGRDVGGE